MPAKSKSQQRLFGMALAAKRGKGKGASKKVKDIAKKMSAKEIEKFASTKHEDIKESRAMSFANFLNEAFIDDEGKLQDFNFELDPELSSEWEQKQAQLGDPKKGWRVLLVHEFEGFLSDSGATEIDADVTGRILSFSFKWQGTLYLIIMNPEDEYGEVAIQETNSDGKVFNINPIYSGDLDELIEEFYKGGIEVLDQF